MTRYQVTLPGGVGFCNAIRRVMHSDIKSWAPYEVTFRKNTSCQTSEFLAHRIGLIPFRKVGNGTTMTINVSGPGNVLAKDLTGPAFEPAFDNIVIMKLSENQTIEATVYFDEQRSDKHARYSPLAAIGMCPVDGEGRHAITFELNDPTLDPSKIMEEAFTSLEQRVDSALRKMCDQDSVPETMC